MRENREIREKKEAGRKALLNVEDVLYRIFSFVFQSERGIIMYCSCSGKREGGGGGGGMQRQSINH